MKRSYHSFYVAKEKSEKNYLKLKKWDDRFALFRLISTVTVFALMFSFYDKIPLFVMVFFAFVFILLCSVVHKKIQKKQKFWKSIDQSYDLSVARIKRNFAKLKKHVQPWHQDVGQVPENHIYAFDLDVLTNLFLFLNTCSTFEGSEKLFHLLLQGGISPEEASLVSKRSKFAEILSKQSAFLRRFESIRLQDDFVRMDPAVEPRDDTSEPRDDKMTVGIWKERLQSFYAVLNIGAWLVFILPTVIQFLKTQPHDAGIFIQPMLFYSLLVLINVVVFNSLVKNSYQMIRDSKIFSEILFFLNQGNQNLNGLDFQFLDKKALRQIKWMQFFVDLISVRGNPIFWIALHLFDAIVCLLLQWKLSSLKSQFPTWQQELYEFDVIASFARLKKENPQFHFLTEQERSFSDLSFIDIQDMGHPLLPSENCICNSIRLTKESPLVLLTGSNMAGKSTFLRAIATNILLANIGAPICAQKFLVPQSMILCAIRINDSLAEGTSYFYAEVKRLRAILDELEKNKGTHSALFFIDEIFKGTNNKERFIGSWHVIKALLEKQAFGFVSTHDLALSELEEKDKRVRNMHFREHIEDNKLVFDYVIKEGPCPTSNATYIMRLEGLPIPEGEGLS
jgi:hypothetical protein